MTIWTELGGLEFRQTYYDVQGVPTRVLEAGSGPPLILLHGTGGHAEAYTRNMAVHAKHFHVYAMDMIGHGYSGRPDVEYGVMDFVDHVRGFLDVIGARSAYVSGESLGGVVGAWLAVTHPAYVGKLVLNTGILMPLPASGRAQIADVLARSKAVASNLTREVVRKRIEWLMHDPASVTDEIIDVRHQIYSQPGMAETMGRISSTILGGAIDEEWSAKWFDCQQMRKIECPVLVLWSRHNPGQPAELAAEAMRYLPDGRLVVLEHSAHWPQWEEAELFNRVHVDFLLGNGDVRS